MILIVDEDKRKRAYDLSSILEVSGLSSIVTDSDHIKSYTGAIAALVFTPSESYLSKVSVRCEKIPVIAVNESGSRIYNKDVAFYDETVHGSIGDFVFEFLHQKYGITKSDYKCGELRILDHCVMLGIAYLNLTKSEKRILTMLALCNGWVSEKTVLKACFKNIGGKSSTRVPVHICNINKKARKISGLPIIQTRRGVGYRVAKDL